MIKKSLQLEYERNEYYRKDREIRSQLWYLHGFFSEDYDLEDIEVFSRVESHYNNHFIINDKKTKTFYIGAFDDDIYEMSHEEIVEYATEDTCCKISIKNFISFAETWLEIKKNRTPFALIYQDEHDWIDAKPFETQEAMELFIKNHS